MMRRFVLLSAFFLLVAASWVATGEGSLEPMDPSEPMDWCVPTDLCVVDEAGRGEAVFQFEADVDTGLGTFTYSDHRVSYSGRKVSVTAEVTEVEYNGLLPWHFSYYLRGTYQAKGGSAVPAGLFDGWFYWSSYSETPYVVIWLRESGGLGFSYMNQGQMTGGYLYHPELEPSGPMYDLGTLGPSPAHYSNADAINNRGQVVGDSSVGTEWHMFLWEKGEMVDLGAPPWGTPDFVWPTAINESGQIVGTLRTSEVAQSGFLFENGEWTLIKAEDTNWSNAVDINNRGQIVGNDTPMDQPMRLFVWERGEFTFLDLDLPGWGPYLVPEAINNRGDLIFYYFDSSPGPGIPPLTRSVMWDHGVATEVGDPTLQDTIVHGLNDHGQVVGQYRLRGSDEGVAFLWDGGTFFELPGLGGDWAEARDINNRGQIVGVTRTAEGDDHAVLWENGQVQDLGTLGGSEGGPESYAYGINERGQVVGWSRTEWGSIHGFLWEK